MISLCVLEANSHEKTTLFERRVLVWVLVSCGWAADYGKGPGLG